MIKKRAHYPKHIKECAYCHNPFEKNPRMGWKYFLEKKNYCNRKCQNDSRKLQRRCELCSTVFHAKLHKVHQGKDRFCSRKCANAVLTPKQPEDRLTCDYCKKIFYRGSWRKKYDRAYCSRACFHNGQRKTTA